MADRTPTPEGNGSTIRFRLGELETDMRFVMGRTSEDHALIGRHEEQINGEGGLNKRVAALTAEVSGLRKAILTAALGLPVAGVTFMLGILALVQP